MITTAIEASQASTYSGFDFENVWAIEEGTTTPYLKGMMIFDANYVSNIKNTMFEGSGTLEDPYIIKTLEDLNNVRKLNHSHYRLANNIDGNGISFETITDFYGSIDGNNYTISD